MSNLIISDEIFKHLITCEVEHQNELNVKKFIAKIKVEKWANKNDVLQNFLYWQQTDAQNFLNLSKEEKMNRFSNEKTSTEEIEQKINNTIKLCNEFLKLTLNSFKSMYDL